MGDTVLTNPTLESDYKAIADGWKLMKKYHQISETNEYWDNLIVDVGEYARSGSESDDLRQEIGMAIINTLDMRHRNSRISHVEG